MALNFNPFYWQKMLRRSKFIHSGGGEGRRILHHRVRFESPPPAALLLEPPVTPMKRSLTARVKSRSVPSKAARKLGTPTRAAFTAVSPARRTAAPLLIGGTLDIHIYCTQYHAMTQ